MEQNFQRKIDLDYVLFLKSYYSYFLEWFSTHMTENNFFNRLQAYKRDKFNADALTAFDELLEDMMTYMEQEEQCYEREFEYDPLIDLEYVEELNSLYRQRKVDYCRYFEEVHLQSIIKLYMRTTWLDPVYLAPDAIDLFGRLQSEMLSLISREE